MLVIRQSHFPQDPRVRREVLALLGAGCEVDVLCTRRPGEPLLERDGNLRTIRVPLWHRRGGALGYVAEYLLFLGVATVLAAGLHLRRRYRLVQVHTLPDTLAFAGVIPRLLGARVLLDLHECMPEFFSTRFGVPLDHPLVKAVGRAEQASIRFADQAVTCTAQMRDAFIGRGADPEHLAVVLNAADEEVFRPAPSAATSSDGEFVVLCHGAIEERYGHDTAIRAVALLADELPGLRLDVYGEGTQRSAMQRLAADLGVAERVRFSDGFVPIEDLVKAIAEADAGLVAMKRDAFRDLTHCNKMYDFIAMRKPVITSRTASVAAYFDEPCFAWFESGDERDLARAIRALHDDADLRCALVARASRRAEPYRWEHQRRTYLAVVQRLLDDPQVGGQRRRSRERDPVVP